LSIYISTHAYTYILHTRKKDIHTYVYMYFFVYTCVQVDLRIAAQKTDMDALELLYSLDIPFLVVGTKAGIRDAFRCVT